MKKITLIAVMLGLVLVSMGQNQISLKKNYGKTPAEMVNLNLVLDSKDLPIIEPIPEYSDNFTKSQSDVPDLEVSASGFVNEYYAVPMDQIKTFSQVTSTIQANISNIGADLTAATKITVTNNGDYSDEVDLRIPFDSLESRDIVFNDFATTTLGTYTFTFTADASNDFDASNGTAVAEIEVTETDLIRDNGDITSSMGIGTGGGGYLGNVFTINNVDTLNSVTLHLVSPTIGDVMNVAVFDLYSDGTPNTMIASSIDFIVTGQDQDYTAYFAGEGVILEPGKYLIAVREDVNGMSLASTSTTYTSLTSWVYYKTFWIKLETLGYPRTFYLRPGFGTEPPAFDVEMISLDMYEYIVKGDELTVEGVFINHGVDALTSFDISYTVNDGTPIVESFTGQSINGFYSFSLTTPIKLSEAGDYDIDVTILNINGSHDDDTSNNNLEMMISALEYAPVKNIFGEEATGTWCGWCVRGHVFMDFMTENYPENWIGVAVHNGDPMVVEEYDEAIGDFIPGYPSGLVNRVGYCDPSSFQAVYNVLMELPSPVEVEISNVTYDKTSRELSFEVNASFLATLNGASFNAVISESGVEGSSSGYAQANYYSGGDYGTMGGYENLANPVPADEMVYNHVARAILGGWNGTEGSIADEVKAGDVGSQKYTLVLDPDWDASEIEIIGMVIASNGSVLNSAATQIPLVSANLTFNLDLSGYAGLTETDVIAVESSFGIIEMTTNNYVNYTAAVDVEGNNSYSYKYTINGDSVYSGLVNVVEQDVVVNDTYVGVNNNEFNALQIYPNPFKSTLGIDNLDNVSTLTVSNVLGQNVMIISVTDSKIEINTSDLNKGVYLITVLDANNNSRTMRVVKQ
jgi:hypothetical protein